LRDHQRIGLHEEPTLAAMHPAAQAINQLKVATAVARLTATPRQRARIRESMEGAPAQSPWLRESRCSYVTG
jgi:hypothetical protein